MPILVVVAKRGDFNLGIDRANGKAVIHNDCQSEAVVLSYDDLAWLIHTAGPAALAAATKPQEAPQ